MELRFYTDGYDKQKENQLKYHELLSLCADELDISDKTVSRALECGTYRDEAFTENYEKHRLLRANFCREKLCPTDLKIRSDMLSRELSYTLNNRPTNTNIIFMTVTVPNCSGSSLRDTCRKLSSAVNKCSHLPLFDNIEGYFWSLEITYNETDNTYHPHLHMFLVVPRGFYINRANMMVQFTARFLGVKEYKLRIIEALSYYGLTDKEARRYVLDMLAGSDTWLTEYPSLLCDGLHFGVHVQLIRDGSEDASKYASKYSVKPADYLSHGPEVFKTFYKSLKGLHMHAYSGCLKSLSKRYTLEYDEKRREDETPYSFRILFMYHEAFSYDYETVPAHFWACGKLPLKVSPDGENVLPVQLCNPSAEDYREAAHSSHDPAANISFVSRVRSCYRDFLNNSKWARVDGSPASVVDLWTPEQLPYIFLAYLSRVSPVSDSAAVAASLPPYVSLYLMDSAPAVPYEVCAVFALNPAAFIAGVNDWSAEFSAASPGDLVPVRPGAVLPDTWKNNKRTYEEDYYDAPHILEK